VDQRSVTSRGTPRLRGLLEAAPDGIIVVDRAGRVVHANFQMEKLFGYRSDELVGMIHDLLVPERFRGAHAFHRARYAEAPAPRPMGVATSAVSAMRKDGSEFPAEISLSPLETEEGMVFVAFVRDASERVALLQREKATREEAERAAKMRDEFLAIVAHDLRNPLNVINLRSSILLRKSTTADDVKEQLEQIKRLAGRMNDLIGDLLDVAAIDAGHLRIERGLYDVATIVNGALEAVGPLCTEKRLSVTAAAPQSGPRVSCDVNRVQQVLQNLLANAIKFTPEGGTIGIDVAYFDREVRFSVVDGGPGIPDDVREHVFERYWRGGGAERDSNGGVGLGLFIAKGIVESHEGRIWFESDAGKGSTFHFTLQVS
jgi:PAS domain S-box-containing protein